MSNVLTVMHWTFDVIAATFLLVAAVVVVILAVDTLTTGLRRRRTSRRVAQTYRSCAHGPRKLGTIRPSRPTPFAGEGTPGAALPRSTSASGGRKVHRPDRPGTTAAAPDAQEISR